MHCRNRLLDNNPIQQIQPHRLIVPGRIARSSFQRQAVHHLLHETQFH